MTDAWKLLMKDDLAEDEARGISIGEARGEARGVEIGEARGEARGVEMGKREMVVSLLKADQTVDFVAKVAKMTVEQVRAIGKKAAVL